MDGKKIVSIDQGNSVYVWEADSGDLLIKLNPDSSYDGYPLSTMAAAVTEKDNLIIATERRIYSVDFKGNEIWQMDLGNDFIDCIFNPEAEIAACISGDEVNFIDTRDGSRIHRMVNTFEEKRYFTSEAVFDMEHNKFAVAYIPSDKNESNGAVAIFDFNTLKVTDYETKEVNILELAFCADGNLAVLSGNIQEQSGVTKTGYVEKADLVTNKNIWCNTIKMNMGIDTPSAILKCRKYTDEDNGKVHDEVLLSVDSTVLTWDAAGGGSISEVKVTNGISSMLISQVSGYGYVVENDGRMTLFQLTEGWSDSSSILDTGRQLRDVQINNRVFAGQISFSPDILLMKYHMGYGMEEAGRLENDVLEMKYSRDESYYVAETFAEDFEDFEKIYYFYNTETGNQTEEWRGKAVGSGFADDTVYAIVKDDGSIQLFDLENGKTNTMKPETEMEIVQCCFSQNNRFVFAYGWDEYYVADLWSQEIIAFRDGFDGTVINGGIITDDGRIFYGIEDTSLFRMYTADGNRELINDDGYRLAGSNDEKIPLAVSSDGRLLATGCLDNRIRILDTKKMKTVDEIEFSGRNFCFISFMADNNHLIMQGDTYYYRVYDLKRREYLHISKTQHNLIREVIYNDVSETICFRTDTEMLILNESDYELLAVIENGQMYMPEHALVFSVSQNILYRFPFMNMKMLIQEAEKQFGNTKLSEKERTQYHID